MNLAKNSFFVLDQVDHAVRNDNIKGIVTVRYFLFVDLLDLEIPDACAGQVLLGLLRHVLGEIYAADASCLTDQSACHKHVKACPAPVIQNCLALCDGTERKGVAYATERRQQGVGSAVQDGRIIPQEPRAFNACGVREFSGCRY